MELVVGRIGRPHGVRGEVVVDVRTDVPDERFVVGAVLGTLPAGAGPLTLRSVRWHSGRLLVAFAGIADRDAAQELTGTSLVVDSATLPPVTDPDEFYDHELDGLTVVTVSGATVGTVSAIRHLGQDVLVVTRPGGGEVLIPFVREIVPDVDLTTGRLVVDPPPGLLELGQAGV